MNQDSAWKAYALPVRFPTLLFILCLFFSCQKGAEPLMETPAPPPPPPPAPITTVQKAVIAPVGNAVKGFYVGLPSNYEKTQEKYPVLIYITGAGQLGNGSIDLPLLLKDGPAQLIDEGRFPGTFTVNGKTFSFIVFTPQLQWWPSTSSIDDCIEYVKKNYRADSTRIYLSGLSMGGILSCDLGSEVPNKIAAIIPMAGHSVDFRSSNRCKRIAENKLPVWSFHSEDDPQISSMHAKDFIAKINSYNPEIPAKLTLWKTGGHDAWTRAIEPSYKENGKNIYEWMLQYHR